MAFFLKTSQIPHFLCLAGPRQQTATAFGKWCSEISIRNQVYANLSSQYTVCMKGGIDLHYFAIFVISYRIIIPRVSSA